MRVESGAGNRSGSRESVRHIPWDCRETAVGVVDWGYRQIGRQSDSPDTSSGIGGAYWGPVRPSKTWSFASLNSVYI